jgi:hypothetical protein
MLKKFSTPVLALVSIALIGCNQLNTADFNLQGSSVNALDTAPVNELDPEILTNSQCDTPLNVNFVADETLFTYIAWINYVADVEDFEKNLPKFPEQTELLQYLANFKKENPEFYQKSRKAYDNFLHGSDLYTKNGLLVSASQFYGPAPDFKFYPPKPGSEISDFTKTLASQAPSSTLIQEFYQKAGISSLWKKFLPSYRREINKYENNARILMKDLLCFTNMKQAYPVDIKISLIGYFGISGQTRFSDWQNKFTIQINPEPVVEDKQSYNSGIKVFRHEFSHSLFNSTVARVNQQTNLTKKLETIAGTLKLSEAMTSPQELLARSFEDIQNTSNITWGENTFYFYQNLIFGHLTENLPKFRETKKPFTDFIPELFASYNPEKEIERWNRKKLELDKSDVVSTEAKNSRKTLKSRLSL